MRLERIDSSCNARRYYELRLSRSLFGDVALERRWGTLAGRRLLAIAEKRIGGARGQMRLDLFADAATARNAYRKLRREKRARGYRRVS